MCPSPLRLSPRSQESAESIGAAPGVLVLTIPDNPAGTFAPAEELVQQGLRVANARQAC